jgi:hypothetical protein
MPAVLGQLRQGAQEAGKPALDVGRGQRNQGAGGKASFREAKIKMSGGATGTGMGQRNFSLLTNRNGATKTKGTKTKKVFDPNNDVLEGWRAGSDDEDEEGNSVLQQPVRMQVGVVPGAVVVRKFDANRVVKTRTRIQQLNDSPIVMRMTQSPQQQQSHQSMGFYSYNPDLSAQCACSTMDHSNNDHPNNCKTNNNKQQRLQKAITKPASIRTPTPTPFSPLVITKVP